MRTLVCAGVLVAWSCAVLFSHPTGMTSQREQSRLEYEALTAVRSLKCVFPWFATTDWPGDEARPRVAEQEFDFNIDSIDYGRRTARFIGNVGSVDVTAIRGSASVSFVEQTPAGFVNVTTVFPSKDRRGRFKAVTSRHVAVEGPAPSQNYGYCEVWE